MANIPPFARIACAPRMTLFTRDMRAYIEESDTRNVEMPEDERDLAMSWPPYLCLNGLLVQKIDLNSIEILRRSALSNNDSVVVVMGGRFQESFNRTRLADC